MANLSNINNKFLVTTGGHVLIGATSTYPQGDNTILKLYSPSVPRFYLQNTTTGSNITDGSQIYVSGSDLYITNSESANTIFSTNSLERMRIDSSGNVKLAITNATSSTVIGKDGTGMYMETSGSTNALSDMRFQARASGAGSYSAIRIKPSNQSLEFQTSGAVRMLINSTGNVGISGNGIQIDRPDVAGGKPYVFWKSGGTTQASIYGASSGAGLRIFLSGGTAAFDNSISFTGIVQQNAQSVVLSNSAYQNAAAVQAYATNTANVYPGYGFHKASALGGFLYATSRTELRYRGDGGTDKVLLMADSDYEEGTWTPVIAHNNGTGVIPIVISSARYVKVGNLVYISAWLDGINTGGGGHAGSGGYYGIRGMPFIPENYGAWQIVYASSGVTAYGGYSSSVSLYFMSNGTNGQRSANHVNGAGVNAWGASQYFMMNCTYRIQ